MRITAKRSLLTGTGANSDSLHKLYIGAPALLEVLKLVVKGGLAFVDNTQWSRFGLRDVLAYGHILMLSTSQIYILLL